MSDITQPAPQRKFIRVRAVRALRGKRARMVAALRDARPRTMNLQQLATVAETTTATVSVEMTQLIKLGHVVRTSPGHYTVPEVLEGIWAGPTE